MSGAWSNDAQNTLYIYNAVDGELLLSVDETGLYYASSESNGAYFSVVTNTDLGTTTIFVQPPDSIVPGVTYFPGIIFSKEFVYSPTNAAGALYLSSPAIASGQDAQIGLFSRSNASPTDDRSINFFTRNMYADGELSLGTADTAVGSFTASGFGATETIPDYLGSFYGPMFTDRIYHAAFAGTVQSTSAADRIGLRIYSSASSSSLAGATLLVDYGQINIDVANVAQPFHIDYEFVGQPGKYIVLAVRRASGAGTCSITTHFRQLVDIASA